MEEYSSPVSIDLSAYRNTTDLLVARARTAPEHVAFEVAVDGGNSWRPVTTAQFVAEVEQVAKGLIAVGLESGGRVALMAATRYEWAVCDLAIWFAGGVVVPIYDTAAPSQVDAILDAAAVQIGIGGSQAQVNELAAGLASLRRVGRSTWSLDPAPGADLAALAAAGATVSQTELEARRAHADLDSLATIVFTSGTSGQPKGAKITHRNFVGQVLAVSAAYEGVVREDGNTVIFLPLAHVLARGLQLICVANGMRVAHLTDPKKLIAALPQLRPTFLVVVPRVLQKIEAAIGAKANRAGLGWLWAQARRTAIQIGTAAEAADGGRPAPVSAGLGLRQKVYDKLFYARIREKLGGRVAYLLSGAASLDPELSLLFRGAGVPVVEGYGLTETTAPITGNLPGAIRSGTVGVPLPGSTVRIAADGEVLTRGVGVFPGYLEPADNAEAFVDGFFRTGDLGSLDAEGNLRLSGRVKDVIITAGGKTIFPAAWEQAVENDPLVAHAVLVGEGRPYPGGLILLDLESLHAWATSHGARTLASLRDPGPGQTIRVDDSRLIGVIARLVRAANAQVSRSEQVRRFTLLVADLSEDGGAVTPTMKLKRMRFTQSVSEIIDGLYLGAGTPA